MMLKYLAPLILVTASSTGHREYASAATPAQIKFAEENKYDDTGPGAKKPEYAYHTYKTLDEALVAYLDDPDTKLPEYERAKAMDLLYNRVPYKPSHNYHYQKPYSIATNDLYEPKQTFTSYDSRYQTSKVSPFRWKSPFSKSRFSPSPIYYPRDPIADENQQSPTFSRPYGVYDQKASGSSPHHQAAPVRGHFTFIDGDGTHRTIQYYGGGKQLATSVKPL